MSSAWQLTDSNRSSHPAGWPWLARAHQMLRQSPKSQISRTMPKHPPRRLHWSWTKKKWIQRNLAFWLPPWALHRLAIPAQPHRLPCFGPQMELSSILQTKHWLLRPLFCRQHQALQRGNPSDQLSWSALSFRCHLQRKQRAPSHRQHHRLAVGRRTPRPRSLQHHHLR